MVKRLYASTVLLSEPNTGAEFCVVAADDYDALAAKVASMDGELNQAADESAFKAARIRELSESLLAKSAKIGELEALLREVQTRWWPGCAPMMARIGTALSGARTACAAPHEAGAVCPQCGFVDNSRMNSARIAKPCTCGSPSGPHEPDCTVLGEGKV